MIQEDVKFPFRLKAAIFKTLEFERVSEMPDPLTLKHTVQVKVDDGNYPNFQVFLRFVTPGEQPLKIFLELVGLFELVENEPEPDRSIIGEFLLEQALFMLWPYLNQTIRQITAQMGVNPLDLPTPYKYGPLLEEIEDSIDE